MSQSRGWQHCKFGPHQSSFTSSHVVEKDGQEPVSHGTSRSTSLKKSTQARKYNKFRHARFSAGCRGASQGPHHHASIVPPCNACSLHPAFVFRPDAGNLSSYNNYKVFNDGALTCSNVYIRFSPNISDILAKNKAFIAKW